MTIFFVFFFLSGFCSLVYQVVWLRVAMADFGVTTPLVSIVLSVFMAGLALGSWSGGRLTRRMENRTPAFFVRLYGAAEVTIGISGLLVVELLRWGRALLVGQWGSTGYYVVSAMWIALVLLPFCTAMGATFPLAMAGIRGAFSGESPRSFSYLYVANVVGAMAGTLMSAFLFIELMGFSRTVLVAAALNAVVAIGAFVAAGRLREAHSSASSPAISGTATADATILPLLFTSGLSSLAMEVVWTRQFVPFLGPLVYSFALMLAVYLAATAAGSRIYRRWVRRLPIRSANVAILAGFFALLPLAAADPRTDRWLPGVLRIALGVGGFCGLLGFLTPMLVDRWSGGDPDRAGRAYAVNAIGCIIGPLLSGFVLLPWVGERWTLALLAIPFFLFGLRGNRRILAAASLAALVLFALTQDFERRYPQAIIRRDHTATVIAAGKGMEKKLLINGVGITSLTPITKMMAHLPMASLDDPPRKVLVICFGMGTSYRSALAWNVDVTAVDLVPSVPQLLGFFHPGELQNSSRGTIVIDDGRRFLERTQELFDVIVIDPPPPVAAAGSSLLYSTEFYQVAARRLRPGGMLQQWIPHAERSVVSAAAQAIGRSFSEVRVFPSLEGWGQHLLTSNGPMKRFTAAQLAARVPPAAVRDMLEWGPATTAESQFQKMLGGEMPLRTLIDADPGAPVLTDDRPVNEYYFLRRLSHGTKYFVP
ncbi:MAG TPA: fused MFS/spermidine synthase [Bryobacteraceae bacterium]|nr:fused MFS/spermidine synthase [Bryobacteraceae bacterium]